ncbi:hypothetical protein [Mongoliibacter sp.]|uniref:hypothetical protein n=1 Tax=Mongoliibacter sp. TaxID=2022438 RepID=UPI0025E37202|nr:hypothetical protein [Mongoliibacter sp.]
MLTPFPATWPFAKNVRWTVSSQEVLHWQAASRFGGTGYADSNNRWHMGNKVSTEITLEDKTASEQVRLIAELDEKDKSVIFGLIETMLTKKKFKDSFQKNVAAL